MSEFLDAKLIILPSEGVKVGKMFVVKPTDGSGDGVMDRNSIKTRVNKDGLIETLQPNILLPDYTDGGCGVIKPEGESTNLVPYSEDFTDISWTKLAVTITQNNGISPDGENNLTKIFMDVNTSALQKTITIASATDYYYSFFFKKGNTNFAKIRVTGFDISQRVSFDLVNGTVSQEINTTGTIKDLGNGIFRCSIIISSITDLVGNVQVFPIKTDTQSQSEANDFLNIWGAELKIDDSSYIKTEGSVVTRLKDNTAFTVPVGTTEIIETIDGVEQPPITVIPATYELPESNINKVIMK